MAMFHVTELNVYQRVYRTHTGYGTAIHLPLDDKNDSHCKFYIYLKLTERYEMIGGATWKSPGAHLTSSITFEGWNVSAMPNLPRLSIYLSI